MSDIFISYDREDGKIAEEIARGLENAGYSTWYYSRQGNAAGVSYRARITDQINLCRAVVIIISKHSLSSTDANNEIHLATNSDKSLIPVLVELTEDEFRARDSELKLGWYYILCDSTRVYIPSRSAATAIPHIIAGLRALGIEPSDDPPPPPPPPEPTGIKLVLYIIAAIVIIAIGVYIFYPRQEVIPQSSGPFSEIFDSFNPNRWVIPASAEYSITNEDRFEIRKAPELISPKGFSYTDFEMVFHLKLINAGGVAWAIHARDPRNYYLFYLAGPEAKKREGLYFYIVKDGSLDLDDFKSYFPKATDLVAGGQYQIIVRAKGSAIDVTIIPASNDNPNISSPDTGKTITLGHFDDKSYVYGGIGFRTVGDEQYSIDDLFIQLPDANSKADS